MRARVSGPKMECVHARARARGKQSPAALAAQQCRILFIRTHSVQENERVGRHSFRFLRHRCILNAEASRAVNGDNVGGRARKQYLSLSRVCVCLEHTEKVTFLLAL